MKANELMIDDYIYVKRGYDGHLTLERVKGILKEEKEAYPIRITTGETISLEDIVPIPLTPEILEKNGFVKKEFYSELIVGDFRILCDVHNVCVYHNEHVDLDIPIEYLHELQHAMRICGISKEIEL